MSALDYAIYLAAALAFALALRSRFSVPYFSKAEGKSLLVALVSFGWWDSLMARGGFWTFGTAHTFGILVMGMPLEEWAFFLVIPYLGLTFYQVFAQRVTQSQPAQKLNGGIQA